MSIDRGILYGLVGAAMLGFTTNAATSCNDNRRLTEHIQKQHGGVLAALAVSEDSTQAYAVFPAKDGDWDVLMYQGKRVCIATSGFDWKWTRDSVIARLAPVEVTTLPEKCAERKEMLWSLNEAGYQKVAVGMAKPGDHPNPFYPNPYMEPRPFTFFVNMTDFWTVTVPTPSGKKLCRVASGHSWTWAFETGDERL